MKQILANGRILGLCAALLKILLDSLFPYVIKEKPFVCSKKHYNWHKSWKKKLAQCMQETHQSISQWCKKIRNTQGITVKSLKIFKSVNV